MAFLWAIRSSTVALLVIATILTVAASARANEDTVFKIKRAINIKSFIGLVPQDGKTAGYRSYDIAHPTFGRRDPAALKRAGFDGVRFAIDPAPLLYMDDSERSNVYRLLDSAYRDFARTGLKVIFDLHVTGRDPAWNGDTLTSTPEGQPFQRYLGLIASMGQFLAAYDPGDAALELFNEPPCVSGERWSMLQRLMFAVARSSLPHHTLILTGPCFSSLDSLKELDTSDYDKNTIFTFHFYEPAVFTHQGIFWLKEYKYIHRLPYPPIPNSWKRAASAMEEEVDAAPDLNLFDRVKIKHTNLNDIRRYLSTPMDSSWMQQRIGLALQWRDRMNISTNRIFVGEFGANRDWYGRLTIAREDRLHWLTDVRTILDKAQFPWAVWSDCCAFGITAAGSSEYLDPAVLLSLGMSGNSADVGPSNK